MASAAARRPTLPRGNRIIRTLLLRHEPEYASCVKSADERRRSERAIDYTRACQLPRPPTICRPYRPYADHIKIKRKTAELADTAEFVLPGSRRASCRQTPFLNSPW